MPKALLNFGKTYPNFPLHILAMCDSAIQDRIDTIKAFNTRHWVQHLAITVTLGDVIVPNKIIKKLSKTINNHFGSVIGIKTRNYQKIIEMNWHGDNFIAFWFNSIQLWRKIIELNCLSKKMTSNWQRQFDIWSWIAEVKSLCTFNMTLSCLPSCQCLPNC